MFTSNPFSDLTAFLPAGFMRVYIVLMLLAVIAGTLFDVYHKGSARYYAQRKARSAAAAHKPFTGGQKMSLAMQTFGEAAVSGEFCKTPRRISHLLMMYGFLLYVLSTVVMVFGYAAAVRTPTIWPVLWDLGALMIVVGGLWFFLFLRVNVAFDGDPPWHVGRADLFVLSLIGSALFALIWHLVQSASGNAAWTLLFFAIYLFFTTLLFGSVFWSKFAHMFYKPAVAYQRRVEEANGSSDLPTPAVGGLHCRN